MSSKDDHALPEQPPKLLFSTDLMYGCMLLFPAAFRVFQRTEFEVTDFYTVWYVYAYGKDHQGSKIIPRDYLVFKLATQLGVTTRKAQTIVNTLTEQGCLGVKRIGTLEKGELFDSHKGLRTMVSLEKLGLDKLVAVQLDLSLLLETMIESRPFPVKKTLEFAIKTLEKAVQKGKRLPTIEIPQPKP